MSNADEEYEDLLHFYHKDTLREIISLKEYLLKREEEALSTTLMHGSEWSPSTDWTGHSSGFFSVYSLPPNQAVTAKRQRKSTNNGTRFRITERLSLAFLKKSKSLLKDWKGVRLDAFENDLTGVLSTSDSRKVLLIPDDSASLVVTSPPFLDIVDYQGDNWLRCWFIGVDSSTIEISQLKAIEDWKTP